MLNGNVIHEQHFIIENNNYFVGISIYSIIYVKLFIILVRMSNKEFYTFIIKVPFLNPSTLYNYVYLLHRV